MKEHLNDLIPKEWVKFSKSWFILKNSKPDKEKTKLHPATFPDSLVEQYLLFFTKQDDVVLDPFLGVGTTIWVAEQMFRKAVGIELTQEFADFASHRTRSPIIVGNSLEVAKDEAQLPNESIDYVFTSPPYWNMLHKKKLGNRSRHKKRQERGETLIYSDNPIDLGNIDDVDEYLNQLVELFTDIHRILKDGKYITIVIQNVNHDSRNTPIAWMLGIRLIETGLWQMKGERIWCKNNDRLGIYGYPTTYSTNNVHHYCLTFKKI